MSVPHHRAGSVRSAHASPYASDSFARWDVVPEGRIGALPSHPGRKLTLLLVIFGALAGAWVWIQPETAREVWSQVRAQAKLFFVAGGPVKPTAAEKPAPGGQPSAALPDPGARLPAANPPVPGPAPTALVLNETPAAPASGTVEAAAPPSAAPGSPYAPPQKSSDPLGQRAEAVGLHPDISRAVLARLSPADFRNAGTAIETALAQTADTDALMWPRTRKPEEVLFRVHFVAGAPPDCRRYVVTLTKDGWSTTALPMERCGIQRVVEKQK